MRLTSRIIGLHIVVVGFLWIVYTGSGGNLGMYIDLPSLMIVILLLVGCGLICFTPGELVDTFRAVAKGPGQATAQERRRRVAVASQAYQVSWGAGIVGTFLGLIAMLADLSDPSAIGAGMAVALISTLYGAFLAEFIFAPFRQTLLNHLDSPNGPDAEGVAPPAAAGGSGLWRGAAAMALLIGVFMACVVSFSESDRINRKYFHGNTWDIPRLSEDGQTLADQDHEYFYPIDR